MPRWQPNLPIPESACRFRRLGVALLGWLVFGPCGELSLARAQFATGPVEISSAVSLDEADSSVRAHLERVRAYVSEQQWDEAVETLRQVMETHGGKMTPILPSRFVNLADYCHVQIASLPDEALALYRQRVDALAEQWYQEALSRRDAGRLAELVEKLFCSSSGDDALQALGEIELEQAQYGAARRHWEQLIEVPPARIPAAQFEAARARAEATAERKTLLERHYALDTSGSEPFYQLRPGEVISDEATAQLVALWKEQGATATRLAYPGTTLPRADIRARLVLVSIMEGSLDRARDELQAFEQLHGETMGRLAGRDVKLAPALAAMIAAAEKWPSEAVPDDWPTFAGAASRTKIAQRNVDLGPLAWQPIGLGEAIAADVSNSKIYSLRRIGEDAQRLLSYHPLVVGDLVLLNDHSRIFAFSAATGTPAWPHEDPKRPPGEIFVDDNAALVARLGGRLGVPRFTMTAHDGKLFARMGSQVTSRPLEAFDGRSGGYLVCLDLNSQGRQLWRISLDRPDDEKWAFEGSPLVDGSSLYVAMRKSDVRPQAHVACFDVETKRMRWRTLVCAAETPGGGQAEEMTHNLLTLDQGTVYYNTNLGAVAAISARDGRLRWASIYPRAKKASPDGQDKRTAHFYRDLNPCIYYRGTLLVAPTDCQSIFALDAATGQRLWESHLPEDAVHLLGVGKGNLLASGDALWWIDVRQGKVLRRWPDTTPRGYGRGVLAGDQVIWPTPGELHVFDQDAAKSSPRDPIPLSQRGAAGGNLVAAGGLLLVASPDKLYAFRQQGQPPDADTAAAVGSSSDKTPGAGDKAQPR